MGDIKFRTAFEAGQDYARNGADIDNSNFIWFVSPQATRDWKRGRDLEIRRNQRREPNE